MRNVTEDVKKIVRFVQENCEKVGARFGKTANQNRLTLNMLVDIFIGTVHTHAVKMHLAARQVDIPSTVV